MKASSEASKGVLRQDGDSQAHQRAGVVCGGGARVLGARLRVKDLAEEHLSVGSREARSARGLCVTWLSSSFKRRTK